MSHGTIRKLVLAEATLVGIAAIVCIIMRYTGSMSHDFFLELMAIFGVLVLLDFYSVFALAHFQGK